MPRDVRWNRTTATIKSSLTCWIVRTNKDFNLGCSATQMVISSTESEGSADVRNECERMVLIELQAHESQRNNTDIRQ